MGRSYRVIEKEIKNAEKAFELKGWTQQELADFAVCTRTTVNKFFYGRPVAKDIFKKICNILDLKWEDIAGLESEEVLPSKNLGMDTERENICEIVQGERSDTQVLTSPVAVAEKQIANSNGQIVITFKGDIKSFLQNPQVQAALLVLVQEASGDESVKIEKIEKGSIKITFSGSPESLERLKELITSGELTELMGMPVENVQLLTGVTTEEDQDKIRLVQEIITHGAKGRDISDADLSGADLRGTDFSNADLSCADLGSSDLRNANLERADLNCADLKGTNLSRANLSDANLSDANLSRANLSDADLSGADLSGADLSGANLTGTNFTGANLTGVKQAGVNLTDANLIKLLIIVLPEEVIADVVDLYNHMKSQQHSIWFIRTIMLWTVLQIMWAFYVQIKIENLWLPKNKRTKLDAEPEPNISPNERAIFIIEQTRRFTSC